MSVPTWERNESGVEFLDNYKRMRKEITQILMRDFGIKERAYDVKLLSEIYNISDEDKLAFEQLMDKYHMSSAPIDKYPAWIIEKWRTDILDNLSNIMVQIELANNIYITCDTERLERRIHWDLAIGYCNALKDNIQSVLDIVTDIKIGQFTVVGELLKKEINLLKAVRKSDNRFSKVNKA